MDSQVLKQPPGSYKLAVNLAGLQGHVFSVLRDGAEICPILRSENSHSVLRLTMITHPEDMYL